MRQPRHVWQVLPRPEFGNSVDMAADQVSAEFVTEPQRAFEIEFRAPPPGPGGGHAQRLRRHIHGEEAAIAAPPTPNHGQARTRAGDRSADLDRVRIVAADDG
jgi:hypothetical protein